MSNQSLLQQAADQLWYAAQEKQPCSPIRELFSDAINLKDAYAIQNINLMRALAKGQRIVGKKIGLTSVAVQKQLGVDQPDFGNIFADMVKVEGEQIHLSSLLQPKVEAEIALVLKKDLLYTNNTLIDILDAVDYALPAIEIVDSRVKDWNIRIQDTIADNASSALVAVGQRPVKLKDLDMIKAEMQMYQGDQRVSQGQGSACLGNPLIATIWLANTMAQMGSPMRAGELILTGALGPMVAVNQPGNYQAHIGGLGSIAIEFV